MLVGMCSYIGATRQHMPTLLKHSGVSPPVSYSQLTRLLHHGTQTIHLHLHLRLHRMFCFVKGLPRMKNSVPKRLAHYWNILGKHLALKDETKTRQDYWYDVHVFKFCETNNFDHVSKVSLNLPWLYSRTLRWHYIQIFAVGLLCRPSPFGGPINGNPLKKAWKSHVHRGTHEVTCLVLLTIMILIAKSYL